MGGLMRRCPFLLVAGLDDNGTRPKLKCMRVTTGQPHTQEMKLQGLAGSGTLGGRDCDYKLQTKIFRDTRGA